MVGLAAAAALSGFGLDMAARESVPEQRPVRRPAKQPRRYRARSIANEPIADRSSSIRKLQRHGALMRPDDRAVNRHRERRRDKRRAGNWAAAREEDRILKELGLT